jgi:hypothetical protein
MQTRMSAAMREQIAHQTRKIPVFWVTGGVRPSIEISRIFNTICSHVPVWFLSKNALVSQNFCKTAPFIHVAQCLPTT